MDGASVVHHDNDWGDSLNYVLAGSENMILITFTGASSKDNLSAGQKTIYNSLKLAK